MAERDGYDAERNGYEYELAAHRVFRFHNDALLSMPTSEDYVSVLRFDLVFAHHWDNFCRIVPHVVQAVREHIYDHLHAGGSHRDQFVRSPVAKQHCMKGFARTRLAHPFQLFLLHVPVELGHHVDILPVVERLVHGLALVQNLLREEEERL